MKKNDVKKIFDNIPTDLAKDIDGLKADIARMRVDFTINKPKDTNIISKKKRQLAVMYTALQEKLDSVSN